MTLIEFDVFDAKSSGKVSLDPDQVEVLVDLENFDQLNATQICMRSGKQFFVRSKYNEVKQRILNKE
jgi:uncharacterized protein YlzI (FlbEa/FlbD family)